MHNRRWVGSATQPYICAYADLSWLRRGFSFSSSPRVIGEKWSCVCAWICRAARCAVECRAVAAAGGRLPAQALREMEWALVVGLCPRLCLCCSACFILVVWGGVKAVSNYPASPAGGRSSRWDAGDACSSQPRCEQGAPSLHAPLKWGRKDFHCQSPQSRWNLLLAAAPRCTRGQLLAVASLEAWRCSGHRTSCVSGSASQPGRALGKGHVPVHSWQRGPGCA